MPLAARSPKEKSTLKRIKDKMSSTKAASPSLAQTMILTYLAYIWGGLGGRGISYLYGWSGI